jgi:radical SAM superfamily enzyme YgiQ (UPF0313 family)
LARPSDIVDTPAVKRSVVNVILVSCYELGRQPFGLASPAAWLRNAGASVTCADLSVQALSEAVIATADLIAFYVPMHTATRIAINAAKRVKQINPHAHLCFYGLYAPVNEGYLRKLGVQTILGGEFEAGLAALVKRLSANGHAGLGLHQPEPVISLDRQEFLVPDRSGLPELFQYAYLNLGAGTRRIVGYTEASRGCKHLCRHCPIVPVYEGKFRIVQREVVLEDIRQQVALGAHHITFGDPDFLNGPGHALAIIERLHREFPELTYDVTIKIEHLLKHCDLLPALRDTGCLFVTSAVESFDAEILEILDKRHTHDDTRQVVSLFEEVGLTLNPTFVAFTPWTSLEGYRDFLATILELNLVDNVAPIQYAIRLLIPAGSKLLELAGVRNLVGDFDEAALCYPWTNPDPRVDPLHSDVLEIVKNSQSKNNSRREIFGVIWRLAHEDYGERAFNSIRVLELNDIPPRELLPYLSEPWFC